METAIGTALGAVIAAFLVFVVAPRVFAWAETFYLRGQYRKEAGALKKIREARRNPRLSTFQCAVLHDAEEHAAIRAKVIARLLMEKTGDFTEPIDP